MKKFTLFIATISLIILVACTSTTVSDYEIVDENDFLNATEITEGISESDLSDEEIAGLLQMREEEKLARDVYIALYESWGLNIFTNISKSEQTHTEAVKFLLDRYEIEDPMMDDITGVFADSHLQELYDSLLEQGSVSIVDALIVGATIEDLDIFDLQELSKITDNEDVLAVYDNLNRGSENHMRAFIGTLANYGGSYTPQFISEEDYNSIIEGGSQGNQDAQNSQKGGNR